MNGICCTGAECSDPAAPACGTAHTCVACTAHSQCAENHICLNDGHCQPCAFACPGGTCPGIALQVLMNAGGTVHVCPGRYTGNFQLAPAQPLTVIGAGQGANEATDTILDGLHLDTTLSISGGAPAPIMNLQRLRITGGVSSGNGGGISHFGSLLLMFDCTVAGNTCSNFGAGIFNGDGSLLSMINCTVSDNHADGGAGMGGGIANQYEALFTDCLIENNSAVLSGGGIEQASAMHVTHLLGHTVVRHNTAFAGGGIRVGQGTVEIGADCRVTGNTATGGPDFGGGIYANGTATLDGSDDPSPIVTDNCPTNCSPMGLVAHCAPGGTCPAP